MLSDLAHGLRAAIHRYRARRIAVAAVLARARDLRDLSRLPNGGHPRTMCTLLGELYDAVDRVERTST
jgi:hypothetical protein